MTNNDLQICRVCGLFQPDLPWGENGTDPTHDICDCCGIEFGYEDFTLVVIRRYRDDWINNGAKWWREKKKPLPGRKQLLGQIERVVLFVKRGKC